MPNNRRDFLKKLAISASAFGLSGYSFARDAETQKKLFFKISLAEWSLHKALFAKQLDNLDFPAKAKKDFKIDAVEYVNVFFKDKAEDTQYLNQLNKRAKDHGVKNLLIMIDGEGNLGDQNAEQRQKAVENHYKWINAAKYLGCHSIRVNAAGQGKPKEVAGAVTESLGSLSEYSAKEKINVIVENHGGFSSNGEWLAGIIKNVNSPYCGTLPDFGNFRISENELYDRYEGVRELMPFAKGVSAKSMDFDENGFESIIDYRKMIQIVKDAGYKGYIGIEYEGSRLSEDEGIRATKVLLEKIGSELS